MTNVSLLSAARSIKRPTLQGLVAIGLLFAPGILAEAQSPAKIDSVIKAAYDKFKGNDSGAAADYIPELGKMNPKLFGIAVVSPAGKVYTVGDADSLFSIQSISKVLAMAVVMEEDGPQAVMDKLGVDATGLRFNSIIAIELQKGKEMNPLVNPGAIATVSMIKGPSADAKWAKIIGVHEAYAGRGLAVNYPVYRSESATNQRNQAIAQLMYAYGRLYSDPREATDLYTRQCSINVSARDLATMAATLASGGVNPITKKRVIHADYVPKILSVMATAGLYDDSGIWLYTVGLPAKSGVGGGMMTVAPGKFGIGVFSPRVDAAGNSVRGKLATEYVAKALGLDVFVGD
jgi:glutaminase